MGNLSGKPNDSSLSKEHHVFNVQGRGLLQSFLNGPPRPLFLFSKWLIENKGPIKIHSRAYFDEKINSTALNVV